VTVLERPVIVSLIERRVTRCGLWHTAPSLIEFAGSAAEVSVMATIVVGSAEQAAGATTVAVGLAHRLAYTGHNVRLERLAGGDRAAADAALFATLDFATSSGTPINEVSDAGDGVTVIDASTAGASAAQGAGRRLLMVTAAGAGGSGDTVLSNHADAAAALSLPEDRLLAAPTVEILIEASGAEVLARSVEGESVLCEHIVVGPIFEDSDEPHFDRFARKAIVTRAEKVDIALAALMSDPRCLILTGGHDPSPYLLDRVAAGRTTTLLLAPDDTATTVHSIEGTFGAAAFSGEEKVERIGELMAEAIDDATIDALLAG
jgi:hypothetical protein